MPLTGIRVLDLTRLLPGPYATRLMAELGADVIKVEDPKGGDYVRWSPPIAGDPPRSSLFDELNRGKRSITLDLKKPEAQVALRALVARTDVLMDSFRPGVLARLGLDPQDLMSANPKLIYCAMTGFGLTGPDADRAGHDLGYVARTGGLALTGPPSSPVAPGFQIADIGAAMVALSGVLAALFERTRTGVGRVVDVSLTESAMPFNTVALGRMHGGEKPRRGAEILDGSRPCYGVYRTKDDRFLAVGALEPKFWSSFVKAIGLPEVEYNGLDTGALGVEAREKVQAKLQERTRDEWVAVFREVDACVEPVLELDEVEADAHHRARRITAEDGTTASPIHLTTWAALAVPQPSTRTLRPAPALGAHTEEVLRETNLPAGIIEALV